MRLGAGTLFLVFGTHAPSYMKTAYHKVRRDVKDAVPLPFDIDRAREEIAGLEPAIRDNIEKLARAEVEVEHLDREIGTIHTNMDVEKTALLTLRESLKTGEYRLAGHSRVAYTEDEVKADLARRYDFVQQRQEDSRGQGVDSQGQAERDHRLPQAAREHDGPEESLDQQARPDRGQAAPDRGHPGGQRVSAS